MNNYQRINSPDTKKLYLLMITPKTKAAISDDIPGSLDLHHLVALNAELLHPFWSLHSPSRQIFGMVHLPLLHHVVHHAVESSKQSRDNGLVRIHFVRAKHADYLTVSTVG